MEQRARRWLIWSGTGAASVMILFIAGFFAFWYVIWPMPAEWIAVNSPWTAPQIRARALVHLGGDYTETMHLAEQAFLKAIPERGQEVERGILECLRSEDPGIRSMAFHAIWEVAQHHRLSLVICAEIKRGIDDSSAGPRSMALTCVKLMPPEQSEPMLRELMRSEDKQRQWTGIEGLAKPGAFDLTEAVLSWLQDEHARYQAIELLIRIRDPSAIERVRPFLEDSKPFVREHAMRFLKVMEAALGDEQIP